MSGIAPSRFFKMDGCGNDFVLLYAQDLPADFGPEDARKICDRRTGAGIGNGKPDLGADGVLIVGPPTGNALAEMKVYNADGTRAEMCGNGLRCVVLRLLLDGNWPAKGDGQVRVGDELRKCKVVGLNPHRAANQQGDVDFEIATALGSVDLGPSLQIKCTAGSISGRVTSVGNPHFVVFASEQNWDLPDLVEWGPMVEHDPAFPQRTNVEWAEIQTPHRILLRVWERGVGETQACGSGALATGVLAKNLGLAEGPEIEIVLPGGTLKVSFGLGGGSDPWLCGPAVHRWSGEWEWQR